MNTIKSKFFLFAIIVISAVLLLAYEAIVSINSLTKSNQDASLAFNILDNSMHIDMLHDGLHADVAITLIGLKNNDKNLLIEGLKSTAEDAESLQKLVENYDSIDLPSELKQPIENLKPLLVEYKNAAIDISKTISNDLENKTNKSEEEFKQFNILFHALEEKQEEVSQKISNFNDSIKAATKETTSNSHNIVITASSIAILIVLILPIFANLFLFRRLSETQNTMSELSQGHNDIDIKYADKNDEIGNMSRSLLIFRDNAKQKIALEQKQIEQKQASEAEKRRSMNELADNFDLSVKNIVDTVASASTEMEATSKDLVSHSSSNNAKLYELVNEIKTTNAGIQAIASATEELSCSVNEIRQQMSHASDMTKDVVERSFEADQKANYLSEAAKRIGDVIGIINAIASQINLLALNATIEAARAGDAGKGFAVVATEVKNLAGQTTKATQEIEEQISLMRASVEDTVKSIKSINEKIGEVNTVSSSVFASIEQQKAATQEISGHILQASTVSQKISTNAIEVIKSSEENEDSGKQMMIASGELSVQAEKLRSQVDIFIDNIRSA